MIFVKINKFIVAILTIFLVIKMNSYGSFSFQSFVFIETYSFSIGSLTLIFFLIRRNLTATSVLSTIRQDFLLITYPFIFSFISIWIIGSNYLYEADRYDLYNVGTCALFIPILLLILMLLRNDSSKVKKYAYASTFYFSTLINRIIQYAVKGIPSNVVFLEVVSIIATAILCIYVFYLSKHSILFSDRPANKIRNVNG